MPKTGALISVEVTGGTAVKQGLLALLDKSKDLRPFWLNVFAPKYYAGVQDLFATGGRARGGDGRFKSGAWQALSPKYRVWKAQHYPGQPILVREGTLRESMRWLGDKPGVGGIFDARKDYVLVGTSVPHARFHEHGTHTMPARPFMRLGKPETFAPLLAQWLTKFQPK